MTDTTSFLRIVVNNVTAFTQAVEQMKLISDRIGADSNLSTATAAAAQAQGRSDLAAADFDNLKVAIDLMTSLFGSTSGQSVTNNVNTGGKAVLAFYKIL